MFSHKYFSSSPVMYERVYLTTRKWIVGIVFVLFMICNVDCSELSGKSAIAFELGGRIKFNSNNLNRII